MFRSLHKTAQLRLIPQRGSLSFSAGAFRMATFVVPPPVTPVLAVDGGGQFPVRRIYCVGRNYWDHGIEMGGDPSREPPFFFHKPSDAAVDVSGEAAELPYASQTENFHFEGELVLAIGLQGQDVSVEAAPGLIWGYGVGVDLTRRDLQEEAKKTKRPWCTSKGFDSSAPVGALVPASKVGSLQGKTITLCVNGVQKQHSELEKMIWSPAEIISYLSAFHRLEPGDIIFSGTPAGVGPLKVGDLCEVTVDGLPPCRFKVTDPRPASAP
ncbi:unnamed protein product [Polarella glacialis]|uniref:Fumarylacetoacetase-like C-terminal domain-containing protein n=1 Tax=Polarella glacialis TaxID=89957 RepID=A0A813G7F8_POLGL|nr:unnamed protein product [Polarella glacialis]